MACPNVSIPSNMALPLPYLDEMAHHRKDWARTYLVQKVVTISLTLKL
jgi:hypothetical protein